MKLKKGDIAPVFSVIDARGRKINLADYSKKKLLLCFFRYAADFEDVFTFKEIQEFIVIQQNPVLTPDEKKFQM